MKQCIICGFKDGIQKHHLQKFIDYGSDEEDNLVMLCPNHHWLADFGDDEDKKLFLEKIKQITGKIPLIDEKKKQYNEKLIRAYIENNLGGPFTDKEYEEKQIDSYMYCSLKRALVCRPGNIEYASRHLTKERCELLYLISLLKKQLDKNAKETRR